MISDNGHNYCQIHELHQLSCNESLHGCLPLEGQPPSSVDTYRHIHIIISLLTISAQKDTNFGVTSTFSFTVWLASMLTVKETVSAYL